MKELLTFKEEVVSELVELSQVEMLSATMRLEQCSRVSTCFDVLPIILSILDPILQQLPQFWVPILRLLKGVCHL